MSTGLTVKKIEAAIKHRREGSATVELTDGTVDGLALRVGRRKATWTLRFKFNGRQYRKKLDHLPLEVKEARRTAQAALDRLAQHPDQDPFPQADPKAKRLVLYVAEQYFEQQLKKRKAAKQIERMIRLDVLGQAWNEATKTWDIDRSKKLHWRDRRIASITRRDARDVRDVVYARACAKAEARERARAKAEQREPDPEVWATAGVVANRLHSYLGGMFTWAMKQDYISETPFANLGLIENLEVARDRWLKEPAEIKAVWDACLGMKDPIADVIRLLLLTGQREAEVGEMHGRRSRSARTASANGICPLSVPRMDCRTWCLSPRPPSPSLMHGRGSQEAPTSSR